MIQRIQSILLLLGAISIGLLYNFPFATSDKSVGTFLSDQKYDLLDSNFLLIFAGLSLVLLIGTLFTYSNRSLQIKLGKFSLISLILFIILIIFLFYQEFMGVQSNANVEDGVGLYLPILSLVLTIVSLKYINKDDKLVKSMDRLR